MAPCDFKDRKDNVYTRCILSNTIRTYSLLSSTTLCMRHIMLIKNTWSAFHWFSLKSKSMLLLSSFQLPSTPCWHPTLWHSKCTWFGHSGHALAGAVCDAWMPTVSVYWCGPLEISRLRAARDSCDMNNYSLGRNDPNTQPCHTTLTKTSACLWLRLFGRSTRLNARQNCHPRWATAWTVWTVSQG